MQNIYETFEFDLIKEKISQYAKTQLAKENISSLIMLSKNEIRERLLDLNEMISLIYRYGELPIQTSASAIYLINLAKKTGLLTPRDLSLIAEDVLTSQKLTKYFKELNIHFDRIESKITKFFDLSNLEKEIHRVISSALSIKDNASEALKEIRKKIKKAENNLQSKIASLSLTYATYLNDSNITIRDGHFVLPVKTNDKSKVMGIVYDVSDSGSTTFIEPLEIVEINNELTSLKVMENEEIRKILKQLTSLVLLQEDEIVLNNKIIAELDFLSAKTLYAKEINAIVSDFVDEHIIDLLDARHPLIDSKKVVANTYHIDENKNIVIISGPNAGGKTVSLKTVGLLVVMNQCGLAIPVNKAKLGYFPNIYIDIGDNQSLSDNLSTFSAHMSHIGEICNFVKKNDLVLLDELGTGTDPKEGEALAVSVTKKLEEIKCFAMISSHFEALKEYAFLSTNLENSSMIFDENKLEPTYKFKLGSAGKSYALSVATRFGISDEIISSAKEFLNAKSNNRSDELMNILQQKVLENEKLISENKKEKTRLEELNKKIIAQQENLKNQRENLLKDVNEEKKSLIEDTKKEISNLLSSLNKDNLKPHEIIEVKKKIENLEDEEVTITYNEKIEVNDYVSAPSLNIEGRVIRINKSKAHIASSSGFSFDISIDRLHKINEPVKENKKSVRYTYEIKDDVKLELNIIGLRVEEAKQALMKYIDNCILKNFSTARIIHGFGSGALRKMTREYLIEHKIKFRDADANEGAGGATVILFHD